MAGSHVLVTGASGGVGIAAARELLQQGARVTLHCNSNTRDAAALCALHTTTARIAVADTTDEAAVAALVTAAVAAFGPISTLVVVHGIWPAEDCPVKDLSLARWRNTMAVNLDGAFLFCREYLRQLDASKAALALAENIAIVFVGSTAGKFGEAFHADYSASKSALMYGLTLSLKNEIVKIHPKGRVNTVSPGWIRTPMAARALEDPQLLYQALASSPLKKVSEPEDIARAILFLSCSAMSGNITGISLDVNAGMEGRLLNKPEDF
ncbi:hypothetical protein HK100_012378 [Physocladia obscura]|uniref:Uncharacterized protein n=1 Tax=Physocladia obscura TaxID=109957 RepID=A0AAD5T8A0_9FUNG|nr:hypothetical protein HK100_012378 [Physocladia obscura]